jgi:biopolymer transport protein ExbD
MAGNSASRELLSDINVTPLVDVVLVLLVVMMVTASTVVSQSMAVQLPKSSSGDKDTQELTVTITKTGAWLLNDHATDAEQLRAELRRRGAENGTLSVLIAADGAAQHANVVAVMDLLRSEQVVRVGVAVTAAGE